MKTPYENHKALGHKTVMSSPDGFSKIEECIDCDQRWHHHPNFPHPITMVPDFSKIEADRWGGD